MNQGCSLWNGSINTNFNGIGAARGSGGAAKVSHFVKDTLVQWNASQQGSWPH